MRKIFLVWLVCMGMAGSEYCNAQENGLIGLVIDDEEVPLIGATVRIKGTDQGTMTDAQGKFVLPEATVGKTLVISFVGKQTVELKARPYMQVILPAGVQELQEALVEVPYGRVEQRAITGAVAAVKNRDIEKRPVTSVTAALEGYVAGVQVNNTYGQPGDDPVIRIRGFSSVNGENNPLYVVDGVVFAGTLAEINPADVESISVVKDAAAAALYGNRAANGVILITTKKSVSKRLSVELTVRQGIYARGIKEYDCVGTDDFMEVMWKSYRNSLMTNSPSNYPNQEIANAVAGEMLVKNILGYNIYNLAADRLFDAHGHLVEEARVADAIREDLDWFAPMERKGYRQEYFLSGGAVHQKSNYRFSLGYLDEEGYLKNAGFDRLTARLQLELYPKSWFDCGLSLSGTHQSQNITDGSDNTGVNAFKVARYMAPIYPVHLHDWSTGDYLLDYKGQKQYDDGISDGRNQYPGRHIVWENELNSNRLKKNVLTGQAFATLKLPKGFYFTLKGDLYLSDQERVKYLNPSIGDGIGVGYNYDYQYRYNSYTLHEQLGWKRQWGKHQGSVLLAHENYDFTYRYTALSKSDQILPDNLAMSNFTTMRNILGYNRDYRTESYFGILRYHYEEKYFAEMSFRRDGSSRFHPDHRWGNFWSAGVSWIISQENFMKRFTWLDDLKLRFSYGEVGNDASVGYYGWMSLYKIGINGGEAALYKSQYVDQRIQWETTATYDAAAEVALFGRWNLTVEYFDKCSRDLLFNVSLPLSAGATSTDASQMASVTRNLGSVSNRGWEFTTDVDIVRSSDWRWNVGINATFLKNKILTLPSENRKTGILTGNQKYMEGHSIYEWWLPRFAGVDRLTGNSLYPADLDNYYVDAPEAEKKPFPDKKALVKIGEQYYTSNPGFARKDWCGSALPDVFGSFSTRLDWKGLSLSALFTYSIGGKIYDQSYASLMATGKTPRAVHRDVLKSWNGAPAGMTEESADRLDPAGIPQLNAASSGYNNAVSSRFLTDGSYLWVKNITASYSLPENMVQKLDLQGVRLNLSLENVTFFTKRRGMNPQQSFAGISDDVLVAPKVISLGLTVNL